MSAARRLPVCCTPLSGWPVLRSPCNHSTKGGRLEASSCSRRRQGCSDVPRQLDVQRGKTGSHLMPRNDLSEQ